MPTNELTPSGVSVFYTKSCKIDRIFSWNRHSISLFCNTFIKFEAKQGRVEIKNPSTITSCQTLNVRNRRQESAALNSRMIYGALIAVRDYVASAVTLFLFGPLFIAIAITIRLDSPGAIFFRQGRVNHKHRQVRIFRFRTTCQDDFGYRDDPQAKRIGQRVTRVGSFLRRSSLDELPQLLNVLLCQMRFADLRSRTFDTRAI